MSGLLRLYTSVLTSASQYSDETMPAMSTGMTRVRSLDVISTQFEMHLSSAERKAPKSEKLAARPAPKDGRIGSCKPAEQAWSSKSFSHLGDTAGSRLAPREGMVAPFTPRAPGPMMKTMSANNLLGEGYAEGHRHEKREGKQFTPSARGPMLTSSKSFSHLGELNARSHVGIQNARCTPLNAKAPGDAICRSFDGRRPSDFNVQLAARCENEKQRAMKAKQEARESGVQKSEAKDTPGPSPIKKSPEPKVSASVYTSTARTNSPSIFAFFWAIWAQLQIMSISSWLYAVAALTASKDKRFAGSTAYTSFELHQSRSELDAAYEEVGHARLALERALKRAALAEKSYDALHQTQNS